MPEESDLDPGTEGNAGEENLDAEGQSEGTPGDAQGAAGEEGAEAQAGEGEGAAGEGSQEGGEASEGEPGARDGTSASGSAEGQEGDRPTPFAFRVDHTPVQVPGAAVFTEDGEQVIVMRRSAWDRHVQPRVANRSAWQAEREELIRQRDEPSVEQVQAARLVEYFTPVFQIQSGEDLQAWLNRAAVELPALAQELKALGSEHKLKLSEGTAEAREDRERFDRYERNRDTMMGHLVDWMMQNDPEIRGSAITRDQVVEDLLSFGPDYFYEATEDDPANGVRKGEFYAHPGRVRQQMRSWARYAGRGKAPSNPGKAGAAARNAARAGRKDPGPAVGSQGTPTPDKDTRRKPAKSWEELNEREGW